MASLQCIAVTKAGRRCVNRARRDMETCGVHRTYNVDSITDALGDFSLLEAGTSNRQGRGQSQNQNHKPHVCSYRYGYVEWERCCIFYGGGDDIAIPIDATSTLWKLYLDKPISMMMQKVWNDNIQTIIDQAHGICKCRIDNTYSQMLSLNQRYIMDTASSEDSIKKMHSIMAPNTVLLYKYIRDERVYAMDDDIAGYSGHAFKECDSFVLALMSIHDRIDQTTAPRILANSMSIIMPSSNHTVFLRMRHSVIPVRVSRSSWDVDCYIGKQWVCVSRAGDRDQALLAACVMGVVDIKYLSIRWGKEVINRTPLLMRELNAVIKNATPATNIESVF